MQAPMMNEEQYAQQGQEQQMQQQGQYQQQQMSPEDEVALAKQALGLDQYETQIQQMQAELQESKNNALFKEASLSHANIDPELVKAEVAKMQETNPEMAKMMTTTKEGLDMLFTKVKSSMKPNEIPDNLNDSGDAGVNNGTDFNKKIQDGTANEVDLGDFIIENAK